jgi:GNAT superfamily N-acetyltransferase
LSSGSDPGTAVVERPLDVEAFLARAGSFMATREAENNLVFGICSNLRANPAIRAAARFAVVAAGPGGPVVGAALQTPPYRLVLADVEDLEVIDDLEEAFAGDVLPGVIGATAAAARFAERRAARFGGQATLSMAERIYRLATVREPRSASGAMRIANQADLALIAAWIRAFASEADADVVEDAEATADRWIARVGRTIHLWQDGITTVSMCGVGGLTPNGIRVGPVYTPPEHRGHGYASNLVAEASRAQLEAGRTFVFLFTDISNPTPNRIYQSIGYEPVSDVAAYRFDAP